MAGLDYNCVMGIAVSTIMFIIILLLYFSNRKYKMLMLKNESLVRLGNASRTLTHEIKNPLAAMMIQCEILKANLPEENLEDFALLEHELQHISDLTNKVNEFLVDPLGVTSEIELVSFIKDIVKLFPQKIKLDFGECEKACVLFDSDRARSVIENLIKNSCESTADKEPEVEIILRAEKKKHYVIQICDRGDGIPEQAKDKLFDPFFTTKMYGSGIGLSISREFVKARGGSLSLLDREGGGTIAELVLQKHENFIGR